MCYIMAIPVKGASHHYLITALSLRVVVLVNSWICLTAFFVDDVISKSFEKQWSRAFRCACLVSLFPEVGGLPLAPWERAVIYQRRNTIPRRRVAGHSRHTFWSPIADVYFETQALFMRFFSDGARGRHLETATTQHGTSQPHPQVRCELFISPVDYPGLPGSQLS